ncbi:MAG: hypothetical protein MR624_02715 [Bacteroidales bacterium]|nr:hypothetical protein [Bacteroidales bacterium]
MAKLHISLAAERCAGGQMRSVFCAVAQPLPSIIPANYRFLRNFTPKDYGTDKTAEMDLHHSTRTREERLEATLCGRSTINHFWLIVRNQPFLVDFAKTTVFG